MENKTATLRFTLSVHVTDPDIGPDGGPFVIAEFDLPTDVFDGGMSAVTLPGDRLNKNTALASRLACQAIDKALKRHVERGGGSDTPEILQTRLDPMAGIDEENR